MEQIDSLIIQYLSGNCLPEEERFLLEWLEKSEENRIYFRSLKDIHDLGRLEFHMQESRMQSQWNKFIKMVPAARSVPAWRTFSYSFLRYAAFFILGLFCFYFMNTQTNRTEEKAVVNTTIETGVGDQSKIILPDGSTVWINACSSITYDNSFGEKDRTVSLRGEAYFEVRTDSVKPFLVQADKFTYRVTGTSFNVYAFEEDEEVSIVLMEGGVTIEYEGKSHQLYPEEIFTYNKINKGITLEKADIDLLSAWRRREFVFDEMPFDQLVRRLERSFNVRFVFENQKITKERFGGTLRDYDSLETIMKVIQTGIPIRYRIEENVVYIY